MLTVVGMGPAGGELMTPAARAAIACAEILVGGGVICNSFPTLPERPSSWGPILPSSCAG